MRGLVTACAVLVVAFHVSAEDVLLVEDFENDWNLKLFDSTKKKNLTLSTAHATHGRRCMRVEIGDYLTSWRFRRDWRGYDSLDIDMFNDSGAPVSGNVLIGDQAWKDKQGGMYWNRHNGSFTLRPGANTISFPVEGLYRGEAGSRNNDIKRNIDPGSIVRIDLGFKGQAGFVYMDHIRLVKGSRPEGILAFDFGPPSQVMAPGFTAVTWDTVHGEGRSFGWHPRRRPWSKSASRDDTFPTRLYQDFVEARGSEFVLDLPEGRYHVFLVYDDLGYWGGEHAKHRRRAITAEGALKYEDDRGEAGPYEYLRQFENTEMHPGDNPWEKYMEFLFEPVRFSVDVRDGALNLGFEADAGWSSKVAAIVVYSDAKKRECDRWIEELVAGQRKEFLGKAVERPAPASGSVDDLPASVRAKGYAIFPVGVSRDVYLTTVPGRGELGTSVSISAARGEYEAASFAVRPLKDLGEVTVSVEQLRGPGGAVIGDEDVDVRWVWHCAKRGSNATNYRVSPWSLRKMPPGGIDLPEGLTRQFWITVHVPDDAGAGAYEGSVRVRGRGISDTVKLSLKVRPFAPDGSEFAMGFYGSRPPGCYQGAERERVRSELFGLLRRHGMNQLSGPPAIELKGFDAGGQPMLDFSATDAYMDAAREAGFIEVNGYGGMIVAGLHSRHGYVVGKEGEKWSRQLGVPFTEVCRRVFDEVRRHSEQRRWLKFDYPLCDETRVREHAEKQLVLMKALKDAAPWLRRQGSYSVSFKSSEDPVLHQAMFKLLQISYLNSHDRTVLDKAKELGTEVRIYNQGRTRYSFGWYQWSEYDKGITGRTQWHLLALHGYQWFDLDGREPDTSMINYGRNEVIPTIHLARCREGADDFYYCQTLHNLVKRAKRQGGRAARVARTEGSFLKETADRIKLNDRRCPGWLDEDAYRERLAEAIVKIRAALGE